MASTPGSSSLEELIQAISPDRSPRPFPPPLPQPDFETDLLRPDDLVTLHVAGFNLAIGTEGHSLVRRDEAQDAVLVVSFPPQNIGESAYFQPAGPGAQPPPPPSGITPPPDPPPAGSLPPPGATTARLARPTRLVFRFPAGQALPAIPYNVEGLLNWSSYQLAVTELADVPPEPSLAQVAAAPMPTPPGDEETSIELPYRLILSPNSAVAWLNATKPVTHASRTELWHTRLGLRSAGNATTELSPAVTAPLRAVWSLDYNPARAFDPSQPPRATDLDPALGVTDISPNDRHQLVVLTSVFRGYADANEVPFVPSPVQAQMLILSPLGGWLRSRGQWDPPHAQLFLPLGGGLFAAAPPAISRTARGGGARGRAPASPRPPLPPIPSGIILRGEQLDLSEWVHVAAQGRDHYVRIVYEGHLHPFCHRAALIKITERKFHDVALPSGSSTPVAHLIQREYIVVREPEKRYHGQLQDAHQDDVASRRIPLTSIRLTTLVTPDLTQPRAIIPGTQFSSWIQVGPAGEFFRFHAVGTDIGGNQVEFTTPLIFMSLTDTPSALGAIQVEYRGSGDRRICAMALQKLTHAPRDPADASKDNTTLVTSAMVFDSDAYPELDATFGGFLPKLFTSTVHLPAVEQLLGKDAETTIALYPPYTDGGLDPNAGVFAHIVKDAGGALVPDQLPLTLPAEKAGGIATPNLNISNLTRAHGPLAGDAAKAVLDQFDPADFFGGFSGDLLPKLFGAISLQDLVPAGGSASANAPKTQFRTEEAGGSKTLVASFHWAPGVKEADAGSLAKFTPNDNGNTTELVIDGEVRKPVAIPPVPAGEGSFSFSGKLTNFRVDILSAIALHFRTFSFSAGSGHKLDVSIDLDPANPFEFEGDLAFIKQLSNIIPPGAFGDGPSIDLTPAPGIHVGYGVTLPPAAVGVFSLENISLSAGLDLPLLTGKPLLDFSFAERHHPFLLTVSLLGGGGFVHVQLDTEGMKLLEAALEFGANASINLGVASGGVHIFAGIYFSMQTDVGTTKATLSGYLRMGGELSILGLISMSLEFMLSFTYSSADDKASGRATLTVEVKVIFFSKSVEVSVEKRFGGHGGDPTFADLITTPAIWQEYASKFA
jgi:hypothetical protein